MDGCQGLLARRNVVVEDLALNSSSRNEVSACRSTFVSKADDHSDNKLQLGSWWFFNKLNEMLEITF